jgi:hypothetical protein
MKLPAVQQAAGSFINGPEISNWEKDMLLNFLSRIENMLIIKPEVILSSRSRKKIGKGERVVVQFTGAGFHQGKDLQSIQTKY